MICNEKRTATKESMDIFIVLKNVPNLYFYPQLNWQSFFRCSSLFVAIILLFEIQ
jgi:hypothetical protein